MYYRTKQMLRTRTVGEGGRRRRIPFRLCQFLVLATTLSVLAPHCCSATFFFPRPAAAAKKKTVAPDDGTRPISLFEEIDEMNKASQMAYLIADMRKLAAGEVVKPGGSSILARLDSKCVLRDSVVERLRGMQVGDNFRRGGGSVMKYGLSTGDLLQFVDKNYDGLSADMGDEDEEGSEFDALSALRSIHSRKKNAVVLEEFDDEMEDRRLVFCIAKDRFRKRITIMVRGSVKEGTRDWYRNFQFGEALINVPGFIRERMKRRPKKMLVHRGFYEYLFDNTDIATADKERIDEIRDNVIIPLLRANKGYKLYITGHSLGGALATLIASRAAICDEVPLPINLVTFGAPYVGGADFREAFQLLERDGRIRYIRVTNHQDGVPTLFPFTPTLKRYRHVGMHVKLFGRKNKMEICYPKVGGGLLDELCRSWKNSILYNIASPEHLAISHSTGEYTRRIALNKEALVGGDPSKPLMLNSLYRDENIVGDLCCELDEV